MHKANFELFYISQQPVQCNKVWAGAYESVKAHVYGKSTLDYMLQGHTVLCAKVLGTGNEML